ncbi:PH domain-containing protein [Sphingorhabdus sp. EL138]|uniref:PH domain-containing protein n=1 Tax=Sphingorhabdus sp. EL138 TaxID=2073156 RepID=UPI0020B13BFB|nr:PH domain-containing protein [Sphingorhabdus sp. EL138]
MTEAVTSPDPLAEMEQDKARAYNQGLTPLHPPQKSLIRLNIVVLAAILIVAAIVVEFAIRNELPGIGGMIIGPVTTIMLFLVILLPGRIYRRWGYNMGDEQLRVLRGFMWRTDTIVPFNRIQHIDVAQGPFQRAFGLSTLIVHTAGTYNSIVTLPGLSTPDAEVMRDTIKGHIRQDMI